MGQTIPALYVALVLACGCGGGEPVGTSDKDRGAGPPEEVAPVQLLLKTPDGMDTAKYKLSCTEVLGLCLIENWGDVVFPFVIPSGYKRLSFSYGTKKEGTNSGGWIHWENDNPHDASIQIEAWADWYSNIEYTVYDVLAIKE